MRAFQLLLWPVCLLAACGGPKIAPPVADTTVADASAAETADADADTATAVEIAETSAADANLPDLPPAEVADAAALDAPPADAVCEIAGSTCPVAVISAAEGEQVVPQTIVHLIGSKSYSPCGLAIKKYKWTVKQPLVSSQAFQPSDAVAKPTFLVNAAGEYEFCLDVWDENDVKSCQPACIPKFLVVPNNALHLELQWDTPVDFDLHFAHPLASTVDLDCDGPADPWFSNPFDAFWFNPQPEWGNAKSAKDNPELGVDCDLGPGVEILDLQQPEGDANNHMDYAIGVHYWDDKGFGKSSATVTVWVMGGLALQFTKVTLAPLDMWYVGKLHWPNPVVGGGGKLLTTCYQSGDSCAAGKNLMWQPKGDWCITHCYENKDFVGKLGPAKPAKPAICP